MGEFGVYDLNLAKSENKADCTLTTAKDPVDIYARKHHYNNL